MAKSAPAIYEAINTFATGGNVILAGQTVVAGHPLHRKHPRLFRPFQPTYGRIPVEPVEQATADPAEMTRIEQATAAPGEVR